MNIHNSILKGCDDICDTSDSWVTGLCPSFGIQIITHGSETGTVFSLRCKDGETLSGYVGRMERISVTVLSPIRKIFLTCSNLSVIVTTLGWCYIGFRLWWPSQKGFRNRKVAQLYLQQALWRCRRSADETGRSYVVRLGEHKPSVAEGLRKV